MNSEIHYLVLQDEHSANILLTSHRHIVVVVFCEVACAWDLIDSKLEGTWTFIMAPDGMQGGPLVMNAFKLFNTEGLRQFVSKRLKNTEGRTANYTVKDGFA